MRPMRTASHGSLTGAQQYRKVNDGPEPGRLRPARAAPGQARAAPGQARAAPGQARAAPGQARAAPRAGPGGTPGRTGPAARRLLPGRRTPGRPGRPILRGAGAQRTGPVRQRGTGRQSP